MAFTIFSIIPARTRIVQRIVAIPGAPRLIKPWEIAIKVGLGKFDLHAPYNDFMQRGIIGNDFEILPIEPKHTSLLTTLPRHHKDPFDRLLVAQALTEGVPVVSADAQLDAYGIIRMI